MVLARSLVAPECRLGLDLLSKEAMYWMLRPHLPPFPSTSFGGGLPLPVLQGPLVLPLALVHSSL